MAAEKKRLTREQRPMRGRPAGLEPPPRTASATEQLVARRKLITALEGAILADARQRVKTGELDGPVKSVSCGPLIRNPANVGEEVDLGNRQGRYDCVAVKREVMKHGKVVGLSKIARVVDVLKAHDVGYFFYIGGNDSQDTAHKVAQLAHDRGLDLVATGVPKTIDNDLGDTEFTLLEMFLRRPRRVLERSFILEEVWGYDFPTSANSLEVYVGYLRRKTEAAGEPRLIQTVRGVGYVLKEA